MICHKANELGSSSKMFFIPFGTILFTATIFDSMAENVMLNSVSLLNIIRVNSSNARGNV